MIGLVCPSCRSPLVWSDRAATCEAESLEFPIRDGIPELLLPASRAAVSAFLEPYLAVRHEERWTDDEPELLLGLPHRDASARHASLWRVRARGLAALEGALRRRFGNRPLRVVERGAGVGWLSYRLALDGHDVLATDVSADARDGLGAARHYISAGVTLSRALAAMDRLPLAEATVDVVVNAASLHYMIGEGALVAAIDEAARVLAPGGVLAILDSPVYSTDAAGEAMLGEWRAAHPDAAPSGYLVRNSLAAALVGAGLEPSFEAHWMGWEWTLNYLRHRTLGPREPATMPLVIGAKNGR